MSARIIVVDLCTTCEPVLAWRAFVHAFELEDIYMHGLRGWLLPSVSDHISDYSAQR